MNDCGLTPGVSWKETNEFKQKRKEQHRNGKAKKSHSR